MFFLSAARVALLTSASAGVCLTARRLSVSLGGIQCAYTNCLLSMTRRKGREEKGSSKDSGEIPRPPSGAAEDEEDRALREEAARLAAESSPQLRESFLLQFAESEQAASRGVGGALGLFESWLFLREEARRGHSASPLESLAPLGLTPVGGRRLSLLCLAEKASRAFCRGFR